MGGIDNIFDSGYNETRYCGNLLQFEKTTQANDFSTTERGLPGMDERYTRYIENLRRVRALARPEAHAGMKAADLLEEIKQNAAESYTLMQQSNAILDEVIFPAGRKT